MIRILGLLACLALLAGTSGRTSATILEWSDIDYFEGNYSRIYFDYLNAQSTSPGTFYCINDWMTNRDDGGVEGGLKENEHNLFTFTLGTNDYDVLIFRDGTAEIYCNDVRADDSLENFQSALSWTTSPNDPLVKHTIWEWSFDVLPTVMTSFAEYDPAGGGWIAYTTPSSPSVITSGPSRYQHYVDGHFADAMMDWRPADDPSRAYQDPVGDPWLLPGFNIEMMEGGGLRATHIPEPSSALLLGVALFGLVRFGRRRA